MANIRATCNDCGNIQMSSDSMLAYHRTDIDEFSFTFECPCCEKHIFRPADERTVHLLIASGVRLSRWNGTINQEMLEELSREGGETLTDAEVERMTKFLDGYRDEIVEHDAFKNIVDELRRNRNSLKELDEGDDVHREQRGGFKNI